MAYPYHNKGGWKSKQWLAYSRVAPWFYLVLRDLPTKAHVDLDTDPKGWLVKPLKSWLSARGLDSDGLKPDVSAEKPIANWLVGHFVISHSPFLSFDFSSFFGFDFSSFFGSGSETS